MNGLDKAFENYQESVFKYADMQFKTLIIPWLRKKRYAFTAGMGTYLIIDWNTGEHIYQDIPKRIAHVLDMDIPGMGNSVGSLMGDFNPVDDELTRANTKPEKGD